MRTMLTAVRDREAQLRTHAEELQLLNDLGISMSRSLDLSDIARHVVAVVARHFTTAVAQLLLYDESGGELMKYASAGTVTASLTPLRRTALGEGPLGSAASMRETRVEWLPEPLLLPSDVFGGTPRVVVAVPLVRRSAPLAVLAVASEDASAFDEEQIVLLETMAAQLAPAIESARLFRDLRASYDHTLDALVAALDMRDKETEGHSQRVVAYSLRLARELGVRGGELTALRRGSLLHDIGKIGVPDAVLLKPGPLDDDERLIIQRHPELGVRVLRDIQFLASAIPVVGNHHERWDGDGYPRGLRGDAIPLGARIFGVVDTFDAITSDRPYREGRPYAVAREEIVKGRGSQFDPSVVEAFLAVPEDEWSSLRQSVAARSDGRTPTDGQHPLLGQTAAVTLPAELQALNQLVTTTSNSLSLDDLLDQTAGALAHSLDARGVGAFVYDGTHDELVLAAQHGLPDTIVDRFQRFPVAGFHNEQVVRNAQVVLQPTEAVAAFRDMRLLQQHPAMQSYLCLPLVAKGEVCGVVGLLGTDGSFDGADEQLYRTIGEGVGLAIGNARLHESIQRLSTTDALTGALNRHQLDALLETEADRAARYRCPLAIALIDIDRFRDYNQRHGHNEGDAALRSIVSLMQATVRIPDSVARFGSEEFALVLPETDSPGAQRVAEKVRRAVQDHQFRAGPLTVSVGVAAIDPGESGSAASLVARGMRALEQAAGRNAVRADIAA